ncbi:ubiquitin-protein ligase molybdopterin-converting factor [Rhizoctonia solani AG-3 Rhs1AP]|uniref:Ubiquitin-protein ligase molybdopterin-converting factor n=2 Tax=Rhizoctonia solani AG-3 TaxID=1086053 RepID=A0A074S4K0_9AGAM|nr:ubiquitin-protein ligase molybdopterin-converting factor [Rhizoctonia solani AG-3 Rhs1AP]KEP52515.1 ubiquitin-protein ligase molybdopterin-converting factor [Rhizoctonia solani 123E]
MSSTWLKSENARLAATAVAASALTLLSVTAYQSAMKQKRRDLLQKEVKDALAMTPPEPELRTISQFSGRDLMLDASRPDVTNRRYDETIVKEMLARNYAFFGEEAMNRVRGGRVVVVGCGGVGSWAAVMLMRSGVSHIRLVDFDMVTLSSLNRHAVATLADVGVPKVTACKRFFEMVAPWVEVDARVELWKLGSGGEDLLEWGDSPVDWVIDAIDNLTTKVQLLRYCKLRNIKVFASMGAGTKCDPTRIQISDISNTFEDPLARSVRRRLRLESIESGIPVVYSTEKPGDVKLLPLPQEEYEKGNVHELGAFDDFRVRILPVLGPLPALFGLHIATYIVCDIAGKPIPNPLPVKNRGKLYEKLARDLLNRENQLAGGGIAKLPMSEQDVAYVFEDLHRGRSTIPPHPVLTRPQLSRWNSKEPLTTVNCVVLSHQEVQLLQDHGGMGEEVVNKGLWPSEALEVVRARQKEANRVARWEL